MRKKDFFLIAGLLGGFIAATLYVNRKASTKQLANLHCKNPLQFLHGYVYFRWPQFYLRAISKVLDDPAAIPKPAYDACGKYLLETHHSKVLPLEEARRLIRIKEDISLTDLEQVIPFDRARDVILRSPNHIAIADCFCGRAQENPCLPLSKCIYVGGPLASFMVEHQAEHARWVNRDEAVDILESEHKRGRFHTAWFKDAAGDRFYCICNCCSCCCLGMKAFRLFDRRVITSSGYIAEVDAGACEDCGTCTEICAFDAIVVNEKAQVDPEVCMGCGLCVDNCKQGAIALRLDSSKPKPLDVNELI